MKTTLLVGNPNTGKTSLFNTLTGTYAYVGNWTGVTVDKKVGTLVNKQGMLIDLPGVYDLNPVSGDESVVANALLHENFGTLLNIVDASKLERNLQLTIQLLETEKPMIMALNMIDVAKNQGITVNTAILQEHLGIPVQSVIARKEVNCDLLMEKMATEPGNNTFRLEYPDAMEEALALFANFFTDESISARWLGLQFFSDNRVVDSFLQKNSRYPELAKIKQELAKTCQRPVREILFETRDQLIQTIIRSAIKRPEHEVLPFSDKLDRFVTHPFWGIPIFMFVMFLIFQITFSWLGTPLSGLFEQFLSGPLSEMLSNGLATLGASPFVRDLIIDGIVAGVGGVLVFVPQIFVLFFCISLLEDSGYMARIAVVMDRLMEFFGLNGKSFIPMIISFGCNVPGIMATRMIEQKKERLLTILIAPFMSCSARLPVYALFIGAFFAENQALIVFSLYFLGIILALITAKIMAMTVMENEKSVFFIDLPVYHLPHLKTLWRSTWEKGKGFIRKAGTIIFAGSVFIWLMAYAGPGGLNVAMGDSFMAIVGSFLAPLLAPLGFGTWQAASALITGFLAKEIVVSAMSIIYAGSDQSLTLSLAHFFTPLSAYAFMLFVLLYIPCLATVAVIFRETKSWKWTSFAVVYPLITAYAITWAVYHIGLYALS